MIYYGENRKYRNSDTVEQIEVYTIRTKEKSIWSDQNVYFNFKNEDLAKEFIRRLNKKIGINIEFEMLGMTMQNDTASLRTEISRSTREYVHYYTEWGISFTREHEKVNI